jgi:GntR family transcriptional regulator, transcriptional repressor for pyruvate dehydrogenase complex
MIRQMILSGELKAGQRLPAERELSEALGISRPTVRESLRALIAMNILESRHGSGTYVSTLDTATLTEPLRFVMALSPSTVTELFEARLVIEPDLAALAATRATGAQREQLAECVRRTRENLTRHEALVELDTQLHRLIATAAGNVLLNQMFETLSGLGRDSRMATVTVPGVADATADEHEAIARAVIGGRERAARSAMTGHLRRIADVALTAARKAQTTRTRSARPNASA